MHAKRRQYVLVSMVLMAYLAASYACGPSSPVPTSFPTLPYTPTPVGLPKFLYYAFPKPGSMVRQAEVSSTNAAWAGLELAEIAEPGESLSSEDMQGRVQFRIDDQLLADVEFDSGIRPASEQAIVLGVSPALSLGEHQASIQVRRTSGEVLEFNWRFTVVAEEPTMPGLPEGFQFVRPIPDSTITLQQYREDPLVSLYYRPGFDDLRGGICVGILARKVIEPDEFLSGEEVSSKYRFVALDGVPPGPDAVVEGGYEPYEYQVFDETECRIVASYVGWHHYHCWRIDLAPGRHEATVRLERASGQITEFTWWFVITED